MYWGKVQESAALHTLLQIFPAAVVEEVGLFEVDLETLPATWRFDKRDMLHDDILTDMTADGDCVITDQMLQRNVILTNLPRLGASPDGLILQTVAFAPEDLELAAERLRATQMAPAAAAPANGQTAPLGSSSSSTARTSAPSQQQQQRQKYSSSRNSHGVGGSESLCTDQQIVHWLLQQALDAVICNGSTLPAGAPTADTSSSSGSSSSNAEE